MNETVLSSMGRPLQSGRPVCCARPFEPGSIAVYDIRVVSNLFDARRYLTEFDTNRVPNIFTDALVIGGGVAGLRTAIEIARERDVIVLVKTTRDESSTARAQGGS